jgi:hypothetical protein
LSNPRKVDAYRKLHEHVVSIEASGLKIGNARRYIQEYAYRNGAEASWILDDDIRALYRVPDRKDESSVNGGAAVLQPVTCRQRFRRAISCCPRPNSMS